VFESYFRTLAVIFVSDETFSFFQSRFQTQAIKPDTVLQSWTLRTPWPFGWSAETEQFVLRHGENWHIRLTITPRAACDRPITGRVMTLRSEDAGHSYRHCVSASRRPSVTPSVWPLSPVIVMGAVGPSMATWTKHVSWSIMLWYCTL